MNAQINDQHFDDELIDRFLNGEMNQELSARIESHLNSCEQCAQRITEIAAAPWGWDEVTRCLADDDLDDYQSGQRDVASFGWNPTANESDSKDDDRTALLLRELSGWLDPTDDPNMLGRFAGYEIVGVIGHGGMGIVMKGFELALNRFVAIKVLAPRLASNGTARKRFEREARAAAAVLHDNVIAIHRVDQWHGLPFLVMPYVAGESLQQRIDREGPLDLEATLRIAQQIAAGLAAAHAQGLVHRDIKPANILLDQGVERVTITDFGLARAADDAPITRTGFVSGTPMYMSPEQASAQAIDHRSDLFSLGSVMYSMATGVPPFQADENQSLLGKIRNEPATDVREKQETVPEWLAELIDWCHAKSPADRPHSAQEIERYLGEWLARLKQPQRIPAPTRPSISHTAKCDRRPPSRWNRKVLAALGGFLLMLAGIFITLETSRGTITIESEADNVQIVIKKGGKVFDKLTINRDGKSIRVYAGTYEFTFDGEPKSMEIDNSTMALSWGDDSVVRIREQRGLGEEPTGNSPNAGFHRLSPADAQRWGMTTKEVNAVDELLSESWQKNISLEEKHSTFYRTIPTGICVARVAESPVLWSQFIERREMLRQAFMAQLEKIVGQERSKTIAHKILNEFPGGTPRNPNDLPSVLGWNGDGYPVVIEIRKVSRTYYWAVTSANSHTTSSGGELPLELKHYYDSALSSGKRSRHAPASSSAIQIPSVIGSNTPGKNNADTSLDNLSSVKSTRAPQESEVIKDAAVADSEGGIHVNILLDTRVYSNSQLDRYAKAGHFTVYSIKQGTAAKPENRSGPLVAFNELAEKLRNGFFDCRLSSYEKVVVADRDDSPYWKANIFVPLTEEANHKVSQAYIDDLHDSGAEFRIAPFKRIAPRSEPIWGKEVDGLQLGFTGAREQHQFAIGDYVTIGFVLRNVSTKPIRISYYVSDHSHWIRPNVTTGAGEHVQIHATSYRGGFQTYTELLNPQDVVTLKTKTGVNFGAKPTPPYRGAPAMLNPVPGEYKLRAGFGVYLLDQTENRPREPVNLSGPTVNIHLTENDVSVNTLKPGQEQSKVANLTDVDQELSIDVLLDAKLYPKVLLDQYARTGHFTVYSLVPDQSSESSKRRPTLAEMRKEYEKMREGIFNCRLESYEESAVDDRNEKKFWKAKIHVPLTEAANNKVSQSYIDDLQSSGAAFRIAPFIRIPPPTKAIWGEGIAGLQLGISGIRDQEQIAIGNVVQYDLLIKNVSDATIWCKYVVPDHSHWIQPTVTSADGESIRVHNATFRGGGTTYVEKIDPQETVTLNVIAGVSFGSPTPNTRNTPVIMFPKPGEYTLQTNFGMYLTDKPNDKAQDATILSGPSVTVRVAPANAADTRHAQLTNE